MKNSLKIFRQDHLRALNPTPYKVTLFEWNAFPVGRIFILFYFIFSCSDEKFPLVILTLLSPSPLPPPPHFFLNKTTNDRLYYPYIFLPYQSGHEFTCSTRELWDKYEHCLRSKRVVFNREFNSSLIKLRCKQWL